MDIAPKPADSIAFGRFRVLPHRRELLVDSVPTKLGGRAFDLLLALIETPGAVITKDDLLARVWPDRVVAESNLQTQILALRQAFGADRALIRTVAGRGYQFTGAVQMARPGPHRTVAAQSFVAADDAIIAPTNLPQPVSELIGRDAEVEEVANLVRAGRLVTLTGAGGIGKTRLALAVGRRLLLQFPDGVWLVELSPLSDPSLLPATVAAAVGLELGGGAFSAQRVAQALAGRHLLVVLDTCEHVIDAAATMAEAMLRAGSTVHIMATSREPLRAEGEQLFPVPPLAVPADDAHDLLGFGATRLFVERARAADPDLAPDRDWAVTIAAICRRLDGIPLAIEMAAARVAALGVQELARRLDGRLQLLTGGRRTALPRHQTLRATLDWSHELLAEPEQVLLRRLAVFAGAFSLEAVGVVMVIAEAVSLEVVDGISSLVTKSLVVAGVDATLSRYRLLDTTRAYAFEKLAESGERERLARRHAEYQRDVFHRARLEWESQATSAWLATYGHQIDDLRAALDWAFSPGGDASLGVLLTVDAVPLWLQLSLTSECGQRAEQALRSLADVPDPGRRHEMELSAALATSLYYTQGVVPEVHAAWTTTLEIAEPLNDAEYQLQAIHGLWLYNISTAEYPTVLRLGQRFCALAERHAAAPAVQLVGDRMVAVPLHFLGDLRGARARIDHLLSRPVPPAHGSHIVRYQYDHRLMVQVTLARIIWLQGYPDQALHMAERIIDEAKTTGHPVSLCFMLAQAGYQIALFAGDLTKAERYVEALLDIAAAHGMTLWHAYGLGAKGVLSTKRGNPAAGAHLLREAIDLSESRYHLFHTLLLGGHAEALAAAGLVKQGLAAVEEALARAESREERWFFAELLRIKGELLLQEGGSGSSANAEGLFMLSLDWARRQGALSWELRAATSLAQLLRDQGRSAEGMALLQSVYDRFAEGFDTADLKTARAVLQDLRQIGAAADTRR
jgi:predicted ATPase/DNA-binding winged helix-turn-helix (wHTH) protein